MAFKATRAVRRNESVFVGIMGASGSGKTYSALRLASGMKRVAGGDIYVIDTENGRARHYADQFDFMHVPFEPPFRPSRYLEAIHYCVKQGAKVIVADNGSHAHEGDGGILDWHAKEAQVMASRSGGYPEKYNFPAWIKPKADLQKLVNGIQRLDCHLVMCFRAKEKAKPEKQEKRDGSTKDGMKDLGWMAIASPELVYEMHACMLLRPGSDGVPDWNPQRDGERSMVKNPVQFRELFGRMKGQQVSEAMGEEIARWAAGGANAPSPGKGEPKLSGDYRLRNGEHKGKLLSEVPADYLATVSEDMSRPAATRKMCEDELQRRMDEEADRAMVKP